jgi:putative membrane protein
VTGLATAPRRLHPLTPVAQAGRAAPPAFVGLALVTAGDLPGGPVIKVVLLILMAALIVAVIAGFSYISWARTTFWFDDDGDLRLASGVINRQERRLQLSRLQAVDVVQPIIARLVGLAELKPEVAGGDAAKVSLAFLAEADAHALRNELLARAAGVRTEDQEAAPEAPEQVLLRVPNRDLALSLLLNESLIIGALVGAAVIAVTFFTEGVGGLVGLLLAAGIPGVAAVNGFLANYDFTVAESPDGLRLRRGLLSTRAQTVPPGRVQAVEIAQPLLWRRYGWVRVRVNVAGYAGDQENKESDSSLLLPVAPPLVANALLARVLPGVEVERVVLVPAPAAARRRAPLQYPRLAAGHDEKVFVTRTGRLVRRLSLIPHVRTQSVRVTQGPWQRALGLASMHVDSTPGPVGVTAAHRPQEEAERMAVEQAERATAARLAAPPERWMTDRMHRLRESRRARDAELVRVDVDDERAGAS